MVDAEQRERSKRTVTGIYDGSEISRLYDHGGVVELSDVLQRAPEMSANDNLMF